MSFSPIQPEGEALPPPRRGCCAPLKRAWIGRTVCGISPTNQDSILIFLGIAGVVVGGLMLGSVIPAGVIASSCVTAAGGAILVIGTARSCTHHKMKRMVDLGP